MTNCTYHCSKCGCHFHSLEAFTMHRQGDYASNDPIEGRHCVHPYDLRHVSVLTDNGTCTMYPSRPRFDVTIWTSVRRGHRSHWRTAPSESGVNHQETIELETGATPCASTAKS